MKLDQHEYADAMQVQPVERSAIFEFSFLTPVYFIIAKFMEFVSAEM